MLKRTPNLRWLVPASALAMLGCPSEELAPLEPCTVSGVTEKITTQGADEVDLLFVVDNSKSMKEEQENLAVQLPNLAKILGSGELPLPNGEIKTFTPVRSLHLGVVSSDMGINGVTGISGCSGVGDDGLLLTKPDPSCNATLTTAGMPPNHLAFEAGKTNPDTLGREFGCITRLGTDGCGFEQQLEAAWKALAPSSNATFTGGTTGHGDGKNAGFLRPNSVIAIVVVSDEEDCSIPDASADVFSPMPQDPRFIRSDGKPEGVNSRCGLHAEDDPAVLHDVSRYIEGYKSLRPTNPDLVIFGAIAGVPSSAETMVTTVNGAEIQDFDAILKLDKMEIKFSDQAALATTTGVLPDPACNDVGGSASPARRFVKVAKGFGPNGIIRSICTTDFSSALNSIVEKVANKLKGACLPRTLVPNDDGIVECDIVEYLPATYAGDCNAQKGRTKADPYIRKDENGADRKVCKINQVVADKNKQGCVAGVEDASLCLAPNPLTKGARGWYYDDFTADVLESCTGPTQSPQRIGFTQGDEPENGSEVRFECLNPVFTADPKAKGKAVVNKPCNGEPYEKLSIKELSGKNNASPDCPSDDDFTLRCEPRKNTCQIICTVDANCPEGWVCDQLEGNLGFCVNPTCPPQ